MLTQEFTKLNTGAADATESKTDAEKEVARGKLEPIYPAWMNATLGQRDDAFRWLDRAIQERSPQVVFIRVMPELDNIRSDPRFAAALRRVGVN